MAAARGATSEPESLYQPGGVPDPRCRQPDVAVDEGPHREVARHLPVGDDVEPRPLDPADDGGSRPRVHILAVVESVQGEVPRPWQPSLLPDPLPQIRLHHHSPRVLLPRPPQVRRWRRRRRRHGGVFFLEDDVAGVDGEAGVLIRVLAAVGRHGVLLVGERSAGGDVAVLEDGGGVAKDEVDSAADAALAEELAQGVGVERVLVAGDLRAEVGGEVRVRPQRHRLVLLRPRRVLHRQVPHDESLPRNSCKNDDDDHHHVLLLSGS
ncbi:unnamed protein product [Spirodela intermedia]|uniref:Uncharacterized protein n=1 Tax=Spirodela intermedia TaxID=51605 RepID=A0A7I8KB56_SPIIN|nr:unnamed protein product [Spirodela intermedia]